MAVRFAAQAACWAAVAACTSAGAGEAADSNAGPDAIGDAVADSPEASTFCPGPDAPLPDADAGDVAPADASGCDVPLPALFKGQPPPPKSLQVEAGTVGPNGQFTAFTWDQWVPMVHGPQGGFHVNVGYRFWLPDATAPKLKIQQDPQLWDGCTLAGFTPQPVGYPSRQSDGSYVLGSVYVPGVVVPFYADPEADGAKSSQSAAFCNRFYDLRLTIREPASGQWGEAAVRVRTYDTAAH